MNKLVVRVALIISIFGSGIIHATTSQFRSPVSLELERGMTHYPLSHVDKAWWYDAIPNDREESRWNVYTYKGVYYRCANKSFFNECDPCDKQGVTRKKVSLSTLWFGKEAFRGEEAFAGGKIENPADFGDNQNVALGFLRITPRFDYNEYGAYFGLEAMRNLGSENQWHVGGRINIPVKVIEIEQDQNCKLTETIDDVVRMQPINLSGAGQGANQIDFAARLDFLSTLLVPLVPANFADFVNYDDGNGTTRMGTGVDVSSNENGDIEAGFPSHFVIGRENGCIPEAPFRKDVTMISVSALGADGGLGDGSIAFFQREVNYRDGLGKNRENQGKLFVVPRTVNEQDGLIDNAVSQSLFELLDKLDIGKFTGIDFFRKKNIDLCAAERITGQGDLRAGIYGGYGQENWFVDLWLGVLFPTGRKEKALRPFFKSTGNNRHFEVRVGMQGGWQPCNWFAFTLDWTFNHAFNRTEKRGAPFKGATIRNIGPEIDANVSWNYFTAHADFNFFHPHNPEIGCVIGYELFAKRKDNVCIDCKTAKDFLGRTRELDACILENRTNSMTHKIRGETFHRWNFFEIFAGASHIIAGKNAMQESEVHFGAAIYF